MNKDILMHTVLTHIVSQICFKWIPAPTHSRFYDEDTEISAIGYKEWFQFISHHLGPGNYQNYSWANLYKRKRDDIPFLVNKTVEHINAVKSHRAHYITFYDKRYPRQLRTISDPPIAITVIGNCSLLSEPMTAVIGSRKASGFSMRETEKVSTLLSSMGEVVISGGAYGCDLAAHKGAINSGKTPIPSIVVFASGLRHWYPTGNKYIFNELHKGRAIFLSEKLWNDKLRPFDFPIRNRIITGLAKRVLVMQAEEKSGAMITANTALDQGRDIYVLHHPEDDVRAKGSHKLIQEGAQYFSHAEDYMSQFALENKNS